jgi:hypothetical protein
MVHNIRRAFFLTASAADGVSSTAAGRAFPVASCSALAEFAISLDGPKEGPQEGNLKWLKVAPRRLVALFIHDVGEAGKRPKLNCSKMLGLLMRA